MVERRSIAEVGKHEQQQYDYRLRLGALVGLYCPAKGGSCWFTGTASFRYGTGKATTQRWSGSKA